MTFACIYLYIDYPLTCAPLVSICTNEHTSFTQLAHTEYHLHIHTPQAQAHAHTHNAIEVERKKSKRANAEWYIVLYMCTPLSQFVMEPKNTVMFIKHAWKCDFRLQSNSSLVCNFKHAHTNATPSKQQQHQRQQHCYNQAKTMKWTIVAYTSMSPPQPMSPLYAHMYTCALCMFILSLLFSVYFQCLFFPVSQFTEHSFAYGSIVAYKHTHISMSLRAMKIDY